MFLISTSNGCFCSWKKQIVIEFSKSILVMAYTCRRENEHCIKIQYNGPLTSIVLGGESTIVAKLIT